MLPLIDLLDTGYIIISKPTVPKSTFSSTVIASENPADLGRYKQDGNFYAYKLCKGDRLVYKINRKDHIILLFRVCDHKLVYGRD